MNVGSKIRQALKHKLQAFIEGESQTWVEYSKATALGTAVQSQFECGQATQHQEITSLWDAEQFRVVQIA